MEMLRILGWAPRFSGKMVLMFILGNKCNFCFSCFISLVSWYLGILVNKLASHQFPDSKFVIEEGLERWSWQPSPGLDFPPGGVLGRGVVVGLPRRQGCRQLPLPGRHPALPCVTGPAGCASAPVPACPPDGIHNPVGGGQGMLCPPPCQAPRVSPARRLCSALTGLGRSGGAQNLGWEALGAAGHIKSEAPFWASDGVLGFTLFLQPPWAPRCT